MSINLLLTYNKFVYWNFQQPKSTNYTHTAQLAGLSHSHPIWCGPTKWQLNMTHCRFDFYSNGWMCVCVCVVDWLAASLFGLFNRSTAMDIYSICIQLAFACENLLHINTPRTHTLFTVSLTAFFSYLFPLSVALFFICLEFKNYYRFVCLWLFSVQFHLLKQWTSEMGEMLNMKMNNIAGFSQYLNELFQHHTEHTHWILQRKSMQVCSMALRMYLCSCLCLYVVACGTDRWGVLVCAFTIFIHSAEFTSIGHGVRMCAFIIYLFAVAQFYLDEWM